MGQINETSERVPTSDQRRAIIARDALACVDGFRTIVQLAMEYFFGMRCCIRCPDCACSDLFGSNAKPEGGVLGRVDAVCGSIEAQKFAGSLHVHFQIFVECLHQHTPLHTLLTDHRQELETLFSQYAKYEALVCRQVYEDLNAWAQRQTTTEQEWKEQYGRSFELIDTPPYLSTMTAGIRTTASRNRGQETRMLKSGRIWLKKFLKSVQRKQ